MFNRAFSVYVKCDRDGAKSKKMTGEYLIRLADCGCDRLTCR